MKTPYFINYSIILFFTLCIYSCKTDGKIKEETQQTEESDKKDNKISSKDIDQLDYTEYVLSDLALDKTKDWAKFTELQNHINFLTQGDLSFFKDDKEILISVFTDLKKEIPESVSAPEINVRLSVIETTAIKLQETSNIYNIEKTLLLNSIKDVLVANSNLILQINKKFERESQNIEKPN